MTLSACRGPTTFKENPDVYLQLPEKLDFDRVYQCLNRISKYPGEMRTIAVYTLLDIAQVVHYKKLKYKYFARYVSDGAAGSLIERSELCVLSFFFHNVGKRGQGTSRRSAAERQRARLVCMMPVVLPAHSY